MQKTLRIDRPDPNVKGVCDTKTPLENMETLRMDVARFRLEVNAIARDVGRILAEKTAIQRRVAQCHTRSYTSSDGATR